MVKSDLRSRARALRLTQKEIAQRAGVDPATVWRLFQNGGSGLLSTFQAVEAVIVAEEAAIGQHLADVSGAAS